MSEEYAKLQAYGINNKGQVVGSLHGYWSTGVVGQWGAEPFIWQNGTYSVRPKYYSSTWYVDINDTGDIVGYWLIPEIRLRNPFLLHQNTRVDFPGGGDDARPIAINNSPYAEGC